jgi:hypothetical protein
MGMRGGRGLAAAGATPGFPPAGDAAVDAMSTDDGSDALAMSRLSTTDKISARS